MFDVFETNKVPMDPTPRWPMAGVIPADFVSLIRSGICRSTCALWSTVSLSVVDERFLRLARKFLTLML